jgi:hypothetical protein
VPFYAPCFNLKAQGNLQFNQVLNPSISAVSLSATNPVQSSNITIPNGKVWKVENAAYARYSNGNTTFPLFYWGGNTNVTFYLDDFLLSTFLATNGVFVEPSFPIWLNSGEHILRIVNNGGGNYSGVTYQGTLSVIEFNVVP